MSDKKRSEFERWAVTMGMSVRRSPYNNNDYTFKATQYCWAGWQAAIASVVVDIKNLPSASYTSSGVVYLSDVANAIEEAGVKHNDE